jgi:hypothetical protein
MFIKPPQWLFLSDEEATAIRRTISDKNSTIFVFLMIGQVVALFGF